MRTLCFLFVCLVADICNADMMSFTVISSNTSTDGPRILTFGGVLQDLSGNSITGDRDVSVRLFDSQSSTTPLFVESRQSSIVDGRLSFQIGTASPLGPTLNGYDGLNRYLEVSIDGVNSERMLINNAGQAIQSSSYQIANASTLSSSVGSIGNRTLAVGGTLTNAAGALVTGTSNIEFKIYEAEAGGIALHAESILVNVEDGLILHQLGSEAALNPAVFEGYDGSNRFLEVKVDGDSLSRIAINSLGQTLSGTGLQLQAASTISEFIGGAGEVRTIAFGGQVADASGSIIDGNHAVQFEVYTDAIGGIALFAENTVVNFTQGFFSYQLGMSAPLDSSLFEGYDGFNRFLSVSIDGVAQGRYAWNTTSGLKVVATPEPATLGFLGLASLLASKRIRSGLRRFLKR